MALARNIIYPVTSAEPMEISTDNRYTPSPVVRIAEATAVAGGRGMPVIPHPPSSARKTPRRKQYGLALLAKPVCEADNKPWRKP